LVLALVICSLCLNHLVAILVYLIYPSLRFTGIDLQESGHDSRLIHVLFEHALGMKLSIIDQSGQICLSALHQSSGNS